MTILCNIISYVLFQSAGGYIPGNCFTTFELFFAFLDTIHQLIPCLREAWNIGGSGMWLEKNK